VCANQERGYATSVKNETTVTCDLVMQIILSGMSRSYINAYKHIFSSNMSRSDTYELMSAFSNEKITCVFSG